MRKSSARLKARGEGGVGGATIYEIFKTWEHTTHRCLFVSCTYYLLPLIDIVIFCTIAIIVLIVITKRNLLLYVSMTLRTRQSTIHDTFYPSTRTRPYILTSSCRLPDVHRWCVVARFFPRFKITDGVHTFAKRIDQRYFCYQIRICEHLLDRFHDRFTYNIFSLRLECTKAPITRTLRRIPSQKSSLSDREQTFCSYQLNFF